MNEYKITVTTYDDSGIFPDFFGKTHESYEVSESAQAIQEKFAQIMKEQFPGVRYQLKIEKL